MMKITISRNDLLQQLHSVIGAVERKQTHPILGHVLLRAKDNYFTLAATDMEIELISVCAHEARDEGEITVPARKLYDICKALPDDALVNLRVADDQRLLIESSRSRFNLATLPADEFPLLEDLKPIESLTLTEKDLYRLLDKTAFAMANQDVRYYLNGLLLESQGAQIKAVATDGHRLAISTIDIHNKSAEQEIRVILPRKGVQELVRLLNANSEHELTLELCENHIRAHIANVHFTSKLIDGRYPDYRAVFPTASGKRLEAARSQLREIFMRASVLLTDKFKGIKLCISTGSLQVQVQTPERETAEDSIDVLYEEDKQEIAFNVQYLLDAINHIDGEQVVMDIHGATSSTLLFDPENATTRYVVMPIRL